MQIESKLRETPYTIVSRCVRTVLVVVTVVVVKLWRQQEHR